MSLPGDTCWSRANRCDASSRGSSIGAPISASMVPTVCRKVCQPTPVMPILLKAGWIFFFNTEAKSSGFFPSVFLKERRNRPAGCRDLAISTPARLASDSDASAITLPTLPSLCSSGAHPDASNFLILRELGELAGCHRPNRSRESQRGRSYTRDLLGLN